MEANYEEARGRGNGASWFVRGPVDRIDLIDIVDKAAGGKAGEGRARGPNPTGTENAVNLI